jgi:hypothetical protein
MILWVHETIPTTKSGAASFSKDGVSEVFNLRARSVEYKVNGIVIDVCTVHDSALTTLWGKNPGKSYNGEMKHRIFGQSEVRREELSAVSSLLVAVHLLW